MQGGGAANEKTAAGGINIPGALVQLEHHPAPQRPLVMGLTIKD